MNDLFIAATTSVIVHGLVFFAQAGTFSAPVINVNRAPSSIELSLVATRAEMPKIMETMKEPIKEQKIDPAAFPEILKRAEGQKTSEQKAATQERASLNTQQGVLGHAEPLSFKNSAPVYPRLARERGYEGEVVLKVEVLQNGNCSLAAVKKSSGYGILDEAAVKAVRGWKFKPAMRGAQAFTSTIEVPIVFRLKSE
jgi:periplasmic protein TonB